MRDKKCRISSYFARPAGKSFKSRRMSKFVFCAGASTVPDARYWLTSGTQVNFENWEERNLLRRASAAARRRNTVLEVTDGADK